MRLGGIIIRWAQLTLSGSEEDQKTRSIIGQQVRHITGMHEHQLLDGFGGAIAPSDPYYLGWRTREHAALVEIGILRHDDEAIGACVVPYGERRRPYPVRHPGRA